MLAGGDLKSGRYRVIRPLGGGAMKRVYLAEDLRLANRKCALAELIDTFSDDQSRNAAITAFEREAQILASLDHPNIPKVLDAFSENDRHYLITEFITGSTLEDVLARKGGRLSYDDVQKIALQALDVLQYLHSRRPPIIYRDIKPSNLMMLPDGTLKMIDFGIARHFQPSKTATLLGTPGYAPPEQYKGKVDPRSDLYSLAAVLHQALTGRDPTTEPPFSFPSVLELAPNVPAYFARAVDLALSYDPVNRPQSAAAMKALLTLPFKVQATSPSTAPTVTLPNATPRSNGQPARFDVPRWRGWLRFAGPLLVLFAIFISLRNSPDGAGPSAASPLPVSTTAPEVKWEDLEPVDPRDVVPLTKTEQCDLNYNARQFEEARQTCLAAAKSGDADAEFNLAYMCDAGLGGPVSYNDALYWYEKAAGQGIATAAYDIGVIYENGEGVIQDYGEARRWYQKAAGKGEPRALAALGRMYEYGKGVRPNLVENTSGTTSQLEKIVVLQTTETE